MHPQDGRVVSNFIIQALRGDDITIYGDGTQTRAFCFVDDLISGLILMMSSADEVTGPINIGNPHEISIRELTEAVLRLANSKSRLVYKPLPEDDPQQRCPDIGLAQQCLGWNPVISLEEGLQQTIDYFEGLLLRRV
jgi:UDP-glucuronate decarboxylase